MTVIGIGTDLIDLIRVERLLQRYGARALDRLLTSGEAEFCSARENVAHHMAARLAAKEATYKALQESPDARGVGWKDMEVVSGDHGKPAIVLHGQAKRAADGLGVKSILVSLSHSDTAAVAVVLLQG